MKINKDTKISELIKANKDSIEAIAALSKPFKKLRNPVLRKLMASRVTIAEAASIGKTTVDAFAQALTPLGFEFEKTSFETEENQETKPSWLVSLKKEQILVFDVREMLADNEDPLKEIMKKFKTVEKGNALCIINTFIPTPLIHLLEKESVLTYTSTKNEKEYHTFFYKTQEVSKKKDTSDGLKIFKVSQEDFLAHQSTFSEAQTKEIDVRHLEMPGPMQRILEVLETLKDDQLLYVHHKRIPIYLLEELESRDFVIHIWTVDENEVKLMIEKAK